MTTIQSTASNTIFDQAFGTQSLLGQLLLNELESFETKCRTAVISPTDASSAQYYINSSTNGTLIPISTEMESYTNLINNRKTYKWIDYQYLFKNVTRQILTLDGEFSFQQALIEIDKFRDKAGEHFYGAILRNGDNLINPFHILTPISYMKDATKFNKQYKVLLFFYSNRSKALSDTAAVIPSDANISNINDLLNNLIKCANHKVETKIPNIIEGYFYKSRIPKAYTQAFGQGLANLSSQHKLSAIYYANLAANEFTPEQASQHQYLASSSSSDTDTTYLLSAHQVMVNGIFAPEYGTSLIKKTKSSLRGTFLTPSASCNLASDSLRANLTWASVCTGSESQATFEGISSLHCSNYASAYNSSSHSDASILLADLSIKRSIEIYKMAGILPNILTDTPTQDELQFAGKFDQYLSFMTDKYKLDLITIETRYTNLMKSIEK